MASTFRLRRKLFFWPGTKVAEMKRKQDEKVISQFKDGDILGGIKTAVIGGEK